MILIFFMMHNLHRITGGSSYCPLNPVVSKSPIPWVIWQFKHKNNPSPFVTVDKNVILTLAAFHERSFGILPFGARRTITAAVTLDTPCGGDPKDLSSVKLACKGE